MKTSQNIPRRVPQRDRPPVRASHRALSGAQLAQQPFHFAVIQSHVDLDRGAACKVSLPDLRRAMAASIACRAAIKINMRLDHSKMEWLLRELGATQCPMTCPHGRPIALRYSTRDILRSFHRI